MNIKYLNINIDGKAVIYNSQNQTINPKNKNIDIRYYFIRELIKKRKIKLKYKKSKQNLADGFTKYLSTPQMEI